MTSPRRARLVPLLVGALILLGAFFSVRAGEARVLDVVPPHEEFRVTSRLLFVVDVSGSMSAEGEQAIAAVRRVLEGPSDELQAGVIAFADAPSRWRGVPEPCEHTAEEPHGRRCVRAGWAAFPGRSKELLGWLRGVKAEGGTDAARALTAALEERSEELTIVFVSDGIFPGDAALAALTKGQATRKERKLDPAGVMVWATDPAASRRPSMVALAKAGRGGLWLERAGEAD